MSRIAKNPIFLPKGVEISIDNLLLTVKGKLGKLETKLHPSVKIFVEANCIKIIADKTSKINNALSGTMRAIIYNMVSGVDTGYEKKLVLVGVGYRAQSKDNHLSMSIGFSHPIEYSAPDGIIIQTPTQTEIVIKGCDKQKIGQVAANIRSYRPPEPYKGKGIKYSDEEIIRKVAKKK